MNNILSLLDKFDVLLEREMGGFIVSLHFKIVSKYKSKSCIFFFCFAFIIFRTIYWRLTIFQAL